LEEDDLDLPGEDDSDGDGELPREPADSELYTCNTNTIPSLHQRPLAT
jgi:hypothetical protein